MHVIHGLYQPLYIIIDMFNYFISFSPHRRAAVLYNWRFFFFSISSPDPEISHLPAEVAGSR